ncbi:COX15/CtaA family protein [Metabacillus sp. RGM 3146]|uniref:COX15/CtaA family protein n=1 Tax=Metabacillus sp. RGM 3146 TaxID=3401092 RepID=UPI003B995ADE
MKFKLQLKPLGVATSIVLLLVLLGGALVTTTGSARGCGASWPLCNGSIWQTVITKELIIEAAHRFVSSLAGILVLILAVLSWRRIGHVRETKLLSILSVVFLIAQALLGAAAVVWGQSPAIKALHFGISLISFASVLLLTLLIFEVDKKYDAKALIVDKVMSFHAVGLTIYTYLVVYTGAFVRHKGAGLACSDVPFCTNSSIGLPATVQQWAQMGHRTAAGILFIWIALAAWHAIKHHKHEKVLYYGWMITFVLVCLQAVTGALSVLTKLNMFFTMAHGFIIACLFGVLTYFLLLVTRNKVNRREQMQNNDVNAIL